MRADIYIDVMAGLTCCAALVLLLALFAATISANSWHSSPAPILKRVIQLRHQLTKAVTLFDRRDQRRTNSLPPADTAYPPNVPVGETYPLLFTLSAVYIGLSAVFIAAVIFS